MGSVQKTTVVKLPTIKLDTTLAELYKRASPQNAHLRIGMIFCGVNCGLDLNPDFPRNIKYLYQDSPFNTVPHSDLHKDNYDLRKSLSIKYLSLIPQRDAFITGQAPVIMFNQGQTADQIDHDRRETEETFSVLDSSQQPELVFCPGPAKIPINEFNIHKLAYKIMPDAVEKYPLTHKPEAHWYLNSKAALAESGLPTPKTEIIPVQGYTEPSSNCCTACATASKSLIPSIPSTCTGPRLSWFKAQSSRIITAITDRLIPFVFKNQQTFGGAGTWVITTEEQKSDLLGELLSSPDGPIAKLLPQISAENAHLSPGSFLICDMVENPINDYGLTFVVTDHHHNNTNPGSENEKAIFLAASEQMTDGNGAWLGSTIDYRHQDALRAKFKGLIDRTAAWVSQHGYFGPVGVDVLETRTAGETASHQKGNGEEEEQKKTMTRYHIVDVNARTSGSLPLPLLRGHFVGRGLNCASSFSVRVKGTRAQFVQEWRAQFEEGRMLILSWYEDHHGDGRDGDGKGVGEGVVSTADVVVGGEGRTELQELMKRVRDASEEVIF